MNWRRVLAMPLFGQLALVACVFSGMSCGDSASEGDCSALLDRAVEIEVSAAGTQHLTPEMKSDLDKQRKQLRHFLEEPFMKECQHHMPVSVVKCRLKAKTKAAWAKCDR